MTDLALHPRDRLEIFESLGSTHDEALLRARSGDPGHLWIMAREQTGGRGRLGRVWHSPPGNLYASLLLMDPAPVGKMAELGFVAGVALADAVRAASGLGEQVQIKWPNDLIIGGAKLSGLLLETVAIRPGYYGCALGFGINLQSNPEGLPYEATNVLKASGVFLAPEVMLAALSRSFGHWLDVWNAGAGFATIRHEWLARAARLEREIRVIRQDQTLSGVFRGIDMTGRLLLLCGDETMAIDAGDVFLNG